MNNRRVSIMAVAAVSIAAIGAVIYLLWPSDRQERAFEAYEGDPASTLDADTGVAVPTAAAPQRARANREGEDPEPPADEPSAKDRPTDPRAAVRGTDDTLNRIGPAPPNGAEPPAPPDTKTTPPGPAPGALRKEDVKAGIEAVRPLVKTCYEEALVDFPDAEGRVTVSFRIVGENGAGRVEMSELDPDETDLFDERLHDCMLKSIGEASFDIPEGGGVVSVTYPFQFARGDDE